MKASETLSPRPIDIIVSPIARFLHTESAGGLVLLFFAMIAMALANSPMSAAFLGFWQTPLGISVGNFEFTHSLRHWINDGLMVLFFFLVGLEVKREMVHGELRTLKSAALPILGGLGGMLVPAALYLTLQAGQEGQDGWGMVMATDIAFVVGCMSLAGKYVPKGFKVFLLTLAIADDIGAILVIAIGYTDDVSLVPLGVACVLVALIVLLAHLGVRSKVIFIGLGVAVWAGFHESGVHATLAGVILGILMPASPWIENSQLPRAIEKMRHLWREQAPAAPALWNKIEAEGKSPLDRSVELLHPWVSFVIMPIFALANAGVALNFQMLASPLTLAIVLGLWIGKPLGIFTFCFVAVRLGMAQLPQGVTWAMIAAGGILAGIGFTMSLFIAGLALSGSLLETAKAGILLASLLAAGCGLTALVLTTRPRRLADAAND